MGSSSPRNRGVLTDGNVSFLQPGRMAADGRVCPQNRAISGRDEASLEVESNPFVFLQPLRIRPLKNLTTDDCDRYCTDTCISAFGCFSPPAANAAEDRADDHRTRQATGRSVGAARRPAAKKADRRDPAAGRRHSVCRQLEYRRMGCEEVVPRPAGDQPWIRRFHHRRFGPFRRPESSLPCEAAHHRLLRRRQRHCRRPRPERRS